MGGWSLDQLMELAGLSVSQAGMWSSHGALQAQKKNNQGLTHLR